MKASQKNAQMYLEKYGISNLFEDMMTSLLKDMPDDPVFYLLKLLQKVYQKKNEHQLLSNTSLKGKDFGLTGSAIPKKFSSDPQVVLPGSKPVVSIWAKGYEEKETEEKREYDKPWLSGTKPSPMAKKSKDKKAGTVEDWNKKPVKNYEDLFEKSKSQTLPLSKKSRPALSRSFTDASYHTDHACSNINKKPGVVANQNSQNDSNDELIVRSNSVGKKLTISPSTYTKFKKHCSKKKSAEQKKKLQALLTSKKPEVAPLQLSISTDDEGIEIIENLSDLASEGVVTSSTTKKRYIQKRIECTPAYCTRCSKEMSERTIQPIQKGIDEEAEDFFKPSPRKLFTRVKVSGDEEDFESVSQINISKPYKPSWPLLSDSEDDDSSKLEKTVGSRRQTSVIKSDKSDFFVKNNPLRKKHHASNFGTGKEQSSAVLLSSKSLAEKPPTSQVWKLVDTGSEGGSEGDNESEAVEGLSGTKNWVHQPLYPDDVSDL